MSRSEIPAIVSFVFRLVIGLIFLTAGLAKISDPVRFLLTLREFQIFPDMSERFLALYIPWLEFVLGFFLILGIMHRSSAFLLACLNIVFSLALLSVILRGIEIDCGCFGLLADVLRLPDAADIKAVVRDLIFVAMCLYIFRTDKTILSLEGQIYYTRSR